MPVTRWLLLGGLTVPNLGVAGLGLLQVGPWE